MPDEEVFGTLKHKPDLSLGAEEESHRPDQVNYLHPRGSTRQVKVCTSQLPIIEEEGESVPNEVIPSIPTFEDARSSPPSER